MNDGKLTGTATALQEEEEIVVTSDEIDFEEEIFAVAAEFAMGTAEDDEPRSLDEAMGGSEAKEWKEAIRKEIAQLEKLRTWELVNPPPGANLIGSRFHFKRKRGPDGEIQSYKARVVAKGFKQVYGIDFYDTFAAGVKLATECLILAYAAKEDWEIQQLDIKSAYLHAELDEEIYMKPPPGYLPKGQEGKVCLLRKGLYGLKQAGRKWYQTLHNTFQGLGFTRSHADHSVFYVSGGDNSIIVAVSVDDMTMAAKRMATIDWLKAELSKRFEITDLGDIHWLLGVKITRDRQNRTITLSQGAYIESILNDFGMADCKPTLTPMDPGALLSHEQCPKTPREQLEMQGHPYARLLGKVMYAYLISFPQLTFAVRTLAQFMHNPGKPHWEALKRVLRYLQGAKDSVLVLGATDNGLEAYSDSDHARQIDRHSISGFAFLYGGGAVSWSSKRQSVIALSSTEAEYIALANATREAIWLRRLYSEIVSPLAHPTPIFSDNQGVKSLMKDNMNHVCMKHIDVQYHFTREAVESHAITIIYVPTEEMTADIFMKLLPTPLFSKFCHALRVRSAQGGVLR